MVRETNRLVIDFLEGDLTTEEVAQCLLERDEKLRLEIESSHPLGYFSGILASVFPEARFVVTIRDPMKWLQSRLNYDYSVKPSEWQEYRDYFWNSDKYQLSPEESVLKDYDLQSLDVYLQQYSDHYRRVLSEVPEDRMLIVRTCDIDERLTEIAEFIGADPILVAPVHTNERSTKISALDEIPVEFGKEKIRFHCGDLIQQFFPDSKHEYGLI